MALKLIGTLLGNRETQTGRTVRIYHNWDLDEFVVKLYLRGTHYEPADYFTGDQDDAWDTGMALLGAPLR